MTPAGILDPRTCLAVSGPASLASSAQYESRSRATSPSSATTGSSRRTSTCASRNGSKLVALLTRHRDNPLSLMAAPQLRGDGAAMEANVPTASNSSNPGSGIEESTVNTATRHFSDWTRKASSSRRVRIPDKCSHEYSAIWPGNKTVLRRITTGVHSARSIVARTSPYRIAEQLQSRNESRSTTAVGALPAIYRRVDDRSSGRLGTNAGSQLGASLNVRVLDDTGGRRRRVQAAREGPIAERAAIAEDLRRNHEDALEKEGNSILRTALLVASCFSRQRDTRRGQRKPCLE